MTRSELPLLIFNSFLVFQELGLARNDIGHIALAPVVDIPFKSYQAEAFKLNFISNKLLKVLDKTRFRARSFKFIIKFNFESVFIECCVVKCA